MIFSENRYTLLRIKLEPEGNVVMNMSGKTVLITGSTDGVGRHIAKRLAAEGANVLIHGRDQARAKTLIGEITRDGHAAPRFIRLTSPRLRGRAPSQAP